MDWSQLIPSLLPAFLVGFLGAGHCVGMCGGIMSVLSLNTGKQGAARLFLLLNYNTGRIASYTCAGVLLGWLGSGITDFHAGNTILRWVAGGLLIAMALYLANWWRGLIYLEKMGSFFWKKIQPFGKGLMPVDSAMKALLLGGLWGWLPCGLVYSALGLATAQGSIQGGALVMLAFGLGTLPLLLITGVAAEKVHGLLRKTGVRLAMALLVFIAGVWTIWGGLGHAHHDHLGHAGHSNHGEQTNHAKQQGQEQHSGHFDHSNHSDHLNHLNHIRDHSEHQQPSETQSGADSSSSAANEGQAHDHHGHH
ncbi:MAG: sulfite exporter TauE/SafE family protein [Cellvibrionaceae bacterium]